MSILEHTIWNQRVPQFLGAFVLFFSFITIFWLSQNAILLGTKAAAGKAPKNVQISNITDTSFTVSYLTDDPVLGTVSYGLTDKLGTMALDDQDQIAGKPFPHRAHHITISKLTPATTYYFSILSDDQTFTDNNAPYEVVTALAGTITPSSQPPLAGKLILDTGSPPTESLVYISSENSQVLSALVKPDGTYLLPLNTIRTKDLTTAALLSPETTLLLLAASSQAQSAVKLLANQTDSVPLITLSKNYDFSVSNLPLEQTTTASSSGNIVETLPLNPDQTIVSEPNILTPSQEEKLKDPKPVFTGKALPNETVEILIESEHAITASVTSDDYGNWSFRPPTPLAPGLHKVTIKSIDASGLIKTITSSFTVYAEGSQFLEASVTKIPQPTTDQAPTVAPAISPTVQPTEMILPTATPPLAPTIGLTPIMTAPPVTPAPITPPGSSSALTAIIITSLSLGIGAILSFLAF